MSTRQINRELHKLIKMKIIVVYYSGDRTSPREIGFNEYYSAGTDILDSTALVGSTDIIDSTEKLEVEGTDHLIEDVLINKTDKKKSSKSIQYKKEIYESIYNCYNLQNIIYHKNLTEKMKKAIINALKKNTIEEIIASISRYGQAFKDPQWAYCKYKMTLDKFLTQNNVYCDWLDGGQKWINYSEFKGIGGNQIEDTNGENTRKIKWDKNKFLYNGIN